MNRIGWKPEGIFSILLSSAGYQFSKRRGHIFFPTQEDHTAVILSLLIFELYVLLLHRYIFSCSRTDIYRLPFPFPHRQLPTEVWEHIIDCVETYPYRETSTFYACTLVCRSWHNRGMLRLYRHPYTPGDKIPKLCTTFRNNADLSSLSTRSIFIPQVTKPVSALFTTSKLKNLTHLEL